MCVHFGEVGMSVVCVFLCEREGGGGGGEREREELEERR